MIYAKEKQYTIYNASCLDVMDNLEENSVDCIVTDPPYEIGFMNKGWDNTGIAFNVETWKKALRVLKPGGYLLAFNHSRTFHRMVVSIEDAGFEIRDTIMWLYGQGFPKALDIEKSIKSMNDYGIMEVEVLYDKKTKQNTKHDMRFMWETNLSQTINVESESREILFKSVSEQSSYGTMQREESEESTKNGKESSMERWGYIQASERELQRCEVCEMSTRVYINGKERWLCNGTPFSDGKEFRKMFDTNGSCSSYRSQSKQQQNRKSDVIQKQYRTQKIRSIRDEIANEWLGWKSAIKPAYEPIVMARKPFNKSVADNVLEYGTGAINIDECRIEHDEEIKVGFMKTNREKGLKSTSYMGNSDKRIEEWVSYNGRFPANVIHDGSKEATKDMWDWETDNDASRYFYTAKASKKDRDEGLGDFETKVAGGMNARADGSLDGHITYRKNIHPTVKPTDLMQYLVRLVAPKGSTVMDIFMGSGSTGKATMIENVERDANYHFIGVDLEEQYCEIAQARIEFGINFREIEEMELRTQTAIDTDGNEIKMTQESIFDMLEE